MKVKDLVNILVEMDQELEVWVASDAEGNRHEKLYGVSDTCVVNFGEMIDTRWEAQDAGMSELDWEEFKKRFKKVAILQP